MSFARGRRRGTRAALVWLAAVSSPSLLSAQRAEPPIIPRAVLFGNPERVAPQVSPDGRKLAARPENKLRFYAATEPFFADYLGGRVEPAAAEEKVEPFVQ